MGGCGSLLLCRCAARAARFFAAFTVGLNMPLVLPPPCSLWPARPAASLVPLLKLLLAVAAGKLPLRWLQANPASCPLQSLVQVLPMKLSSVNMSFIRMRYLS